MDTKPEVLVVMGSDSDFDVMRDAFKTLSRFGISYKAAICSAHRTPEAAESLAKNACNDGFKVLIAAAGLAAHLPGVLASFTVIPVIGVPISGGVLKGMDALYSIVQMPKGIPVATVAIDGAENAALLALQILALSNPQLQIKLYDYKKKMTQTVEEKNETLQQKLREAGI